MRKVRWTHKFEQTIQRKNILHSLETRFLVLDSPGDVEEGDDVVFNGGDPKVSPDPDFVINMKLRQQVK